MSLALIIVLILTLCGAAYIISGRLSPKAPPAFISAPKRQSIEEVESGRREVEKHWKRSQVEARSRAQPDE